MNTQVLESRNTARPFYDVVIGELEETVRRATLSGQDGVDVPIADLRWILEPVVPALTESLGYPEEYIGYWRSMIVHIDECEEIYNEITELVEYADSLVGQLVDAEVGALIAQLDVLDEEVSWHKNVVNNPDYRAAAYDWDDDPRSFVIRGELDVHEDFLDRAAIAIPLIWKTRTRLQRVTNHEVLAMEIMELQQILPVLRIILAEWPEPESATNDINTLYSSCKDFELDIEHQLEILNQVADLIHPLLRIPYMANRLGLDKTSIEGWLSSLEVICSDYRKLSKYK